jgi:hypothetical protein
MNILNRKLHLLEKNVLPELPEEGTTKITWENGDIELDRAGMAVCSHYSARHNDV